MAGPDDHARPTPAVPNGKTKVVHPDNDPDFKAPSERRSVYVCLFETTMSPGRRPYAVKAQKMLAEHGLELRTPMGTLDAIHVDYQKAYDGVSDAQAVEIFNAAKAAYTIPENCLPVIFCNIKESRPENGETFPRPTDAVPHPDPGKRWILLYANRIYSADYVTLLHEIGHAAGLGHRPWNVFSTDRRFDFMATPGDPQQDRMSCFVGEDGERKLQELKDGKLGRNTMFKQQVEKLLKAPFTRRSIEIGMPMRW